MIQSVALEKLRLGWAAATLDLLTSLACYVGAYRLRFPPAEFQYFLPLALGAFPIVAGVHIGVLAVARLYQVGAQAMWPLRLAFGSAIGVPLGVMLAMVVVGPQGLSRLGMAGYCLLFIVAALGWRALVGLAVRWTVIRHESSVEGNLVQRGGDYQSMTGGLLRAFQYRYLLRNLVSKDLKLKYRGSVLGFVWSLVNPLVMVVVYTIAFTYVLGVKTERYAFFVLLGLLAWNFFAGSVLGSTDAIVGGGGLLKSVLFPRVLLPVSGVLFNCVQYLLTVAVFLPVMLAWERIPLGPQMLLFPVFLFLQVLFVSGLALALSTVTSFFRDVKHFVEIGLNVLFWATPIVYEYTLVPETFRPIMLLSPMTSYIRAYQDLFFYLTWPDISVWLVATAYGVGAFVCGISVFVAYEDRFVEQM